MAATFSSGSLTVHVTGPVLRLVGEADLDSRAAVTDAFALLAAEGAEAAVLDLAELGFVDSTILGLFVQWGDHFGGRKNITVRGATGSVLRSLTTLDLDTSFTIEPEPEAPAP